MTEPTGPRAGPLIPAVLTDGHLWVPVAVLALGLLLLALLH
jgi:hypothetical protein